MSNKEVGELVSGRKRLANNKRKRFFENFKVEKKAFSEAYANSNIKEDWYIDYEIGEQIGLGSYSQVYKAIWKTSKRIVAIK